MPVYNYTTIDNPSQVGFTTSAAGIKRLRAVRRNLWQLWIFL
jgi:hypothetical protein